MHTRLQSLPDQLQRYGKEMRRAEGPRREPGKAKATPAREHRAGPATAATGTQGSAEEQHGHKHHHFTIPLDRETFLPSVAQGSIF